eukprot:1779171-Pyramimonas_sp.AAC.1
MCALTCKHATGVHPPSRNSGFRGARGEPHAVNALYAYSTTGADIWTARSCPGPVGGEADEENMVGIGFRGSS